MLQLLTSQQQTMQELKKIILQRIQNIFQLQELIINDEKGQLSSEAKYEAMMEQKKSQKIRSIKENQLLLSLNAYTLEESYRIEEVSSLILQLYQATVTICSSYDLQFCKYDHLFTVSMKENLRKLYCDFFNAHGFKQKTKQVNMALEKPMNAISPAMLLGWLSQWSKKIYCEMLQKQIQVSFETKQRKERFNRINHSGIVLQKKKSNIMNEFLDEPETPSMALNSRANIYGYLQEELTGYYKFINLETLDFNYLKTIKKRSKKNDLLKPTYLAKAAQTLIQLPGQRQIWKIMKQYLDDHDQKYPKNRQEKQRQEQCKIRSPVKIPIATEKKKIRTNTQSERQFNFNGSKLLAPKFSEFQFFKPEQIELKIKKLKILNNRTSKNNLQFPEIRRNSQQIYQKLHLSVAPNISHQQLEDSKREKLSVSCLDRKLREKNFLRCQAVTSKMTLKQNVENFQELIFGDRVQSPLKMKKNISDSLGGGGQYDDRKLKANKNFDLSDLKVKHKIPSIKAKFSGMLKL